MACACEGVNKHSDSIKCENYVDQQRKFCLLKKDSGPWT